MSIFRRPDYTSEVTQFIDQLKAKKPTLEAEQWAGRSIWWDKTINRDDQAQYRAARVAQQAYVYGTSSTENGK